MFDIIYMYDIIKAQRVADSTEWLPNYFIIIFSK